jgi:hypothetical protein
MPEQVKLEWLMLENYPGCQVSATVGLLVPLPIRLHVSLRNCLHLLHNLRLFQVEGGLSVGVQVATHLADLMSTTLQGADPRVMKVWTRSLY